jgi:nitronate monooxygenase
MADGRSLVAALALGADGMNMGTRFIATKEAPVHDHVKQALVARASSTRGWSCGRCATPSACSRTPPSIACSRRRRTLGSALAFADIAAEVSGVYPRIMQQGEMDAGVWSCGMVAGSSTTFRRCAS